MRNSVVFPAPFGPRSATNSPGGISSVTSRRAAKAPKRFSTPWNKTPNDVVADCEETIGAANGLRLAAHQAAEHFFDAFTLARVVFFADGAGLTTEFEAEEAVF